MSNDPSGWTRWGPPLPPEPERRETSGLKPLAFSDLLAVAARILRRHWRVLLAVAIVFQLPAGLLTGAAGASLGRTLLDLFPELGQGRPTTSIQLTADQVATLQDALLIVFGASIIGGLAAAIAAAGYASVVAHDYAGRGVSFAAAAGLALRRGLVVLLVHVLSTLAALVLLVGGIAVCLLMILALPAPSGSGGGLGVFLALVVGVALAVALVVLAVRWSVATVTAALEPIGPVAALRRSWYLTGENAWRTFGVMLFVGLVVAVFTALVSQILGVMVDQLQTVDQKLIAGTVLTALITVLFAPIAPVALAVLYFDLRVRRDAYELPLPGTAAATHDVS